MVTNEEPKVESTEIKESVEKPDYVYKCGYCGSTKPMITAEEMYGPGSEGMWPCCPDCGGV